MRILRLNRALNVFGAVPASHSAALEAAVS